MSLNDFVILNKIGEGAYSSVHKVKRISDGNVYALKKVKLIGLKQKEKENSLNQVRLLASINSDYIIKYKEAFFDSKSSCLCIVIQFADGGDLEKLIERKKKSFEWIQQKQIWKMMKETITGLNILHERNIIHRDLKCANIFISNQLYKIADLNVSKLMKKSLAYTQTGTPYYASPEVWQDKPYQFKSDIWSLGCIIYQLCALKPPFIANNMEGLFKKVMRGHYPKIPNKYSAKLENLISKCLQIDSQKRPSCKELLKMISDSENSEENQSQKKFSSINLLNTIKIPKNIESWKTELPKSDYENRSDLSLEPYERTSQRMHTFGHVSQQKLKDIVRRKNEESQNRKQSLKRINPELMKVNRELDLVVKRDKLEMLPKIGKVHSEPNDRVVELLNKLKEEEKKKQANNRPSWWG